MNITFSLLSDTARYPTIAHEGDAGMDLYCSEDVTVHPGCVTLVKTGIHLGIPQHYFGMVTPRSSMGSKGIIIPNSPGIIDQKYPGELKVLFLNLTTESYYIKLHDRIAQLIVLAKENYDLFDTAGTNLNIVYANRTGGFGSSGV